MKNFVSTALGHMLVASSVATCSLTATAQESYPSRTITMVTGSSAGSGADVICRVIAQGLSASLGQPVIVENRLGANSAIATQAVVNAKADGYTLLFGNTSSTVINQAVQKNLRYDVRTDLTSIAQVGANGVLLVTTADFPASNMKEFIAEAKAHPGKYDYASWGVGTSAHLIMEWLQKSHGLSMNHVPYKSITAITQDMQGGTIKVGVTDVATAIPLLKAGRLKALGMTGTQRSPNLPTVQLMSEQGIEPTPDGWYGVFAPKGTPTSVVALLNKEINRLLKSPELQERLVQLNVLNPPIKSPAEFASTVRDELAQWEKIVRSANLKPE